MENGFTGFISKPIDPIRLDACLKRFVRDVSPVKTAAPDSGSDLLNPCFGSSPTAVRPSLTELINKAFVQDAEDAVRVIESLMSCPEFDAAAFKLFTVCMHGVKSALMNIGRNDLSEDALALETAGKNEDLKFIMDNAPGFLCKLKDRICEIIT